MNAALRIQLLIGLMCTALVVYFVLLGRTGITLIGTGTPVAGGLTSAQALAAIWACRELDWRGMDVVEVCPPFDHADVTAIAGATVVQRYLQILAGKHGPAG